MTKYDLLAYLSPVLTALLGWISVRLAAWIKAKTKNELVGGMLIRLSTSIISLVREAEQTSVLAIKKAKSSDSPGGEVLTPEEAADVRATVLDSFKALWGDKGMEELRTVLGLDGVESVDRLLVSKIEEAVHLEKREAEIVKRTSVPPALPPNPTK